MRNDTLFTKRNKQNIIRFGMKLDCSTIHVITMVNVMEQAHTISKSWNIRRKRFQAFCGIYLYPDEISFEPLRYINLQLYYLWERNNSQAVGSESDSTALSMKNQDIYRMK